jgi:hypothetical protein
MENTTQSDSLVGVPSWNERGEAAFFRDLPALLADAKLVGLTAAYHGDTRIAIGPSSEDLFNQCTQRRIPAKEIFLGVIHEDALEEEEIEGGLSFVEFDDETGTFKGPTTE